VSRTIHTTLINISLLVGQKVIFFSLPILYSRPVWVPGSARIDEESEYEEDEYDECEEDEEEEDEYEEDEYKEDGHETDEGEDDENNDNRNDGEGIVGDKSEAEYQADNSGSAVDELLELVFQLSITFSTEEFVDSQPSSSLLVYFSGILGFSPDARSFLPAKRYTPHLSALVYIQRLLFLEYALPL
jgi:hypothetical protein